MAWLRSCALLGQQASTRHELQLCCRLGDRVRRRLLTLLLCRRGQVLFTGRGHVPKTLHTPDLLFIWDFNLELAHFLILHISCLRCVPLGDASLLIPLVFIRLWSLHWGFLKVFPNVVHAEANSLNHFLILSKFALVDRLILVANGLIEAKVELLLGVGRGSLERLTRGD